VGKGGELGNRRGMSWGIEDCVGETAGGPLGACRRKKKNCNVIKKKKKKRVASKVKKKGAHRTETRFTPRKGGNSPQGGDGRGGQFFQGAYSGRAETREKGVRGRAICNET